MKTPNRDLLVLVKDDQLNDAAMEMELEKLNQLLMSFETVENLCLAHEVFDLNRYKIVSRYDSVRQVIIRKDLKPFEFLFNRN